MNLNRFSDSLALIYKLFKMYRKVYGTAAAGETILGLGLFDKIWGTFPSMWQVYEPNCSAGHGLFNIIADLGYVTQHNVTLPILFVLMLIAVCVCV
ncbi:MAG: hypothetical protein GY820_48575 [Gammaproteobacteria bacterium]|nr:hypothetical protein [Gammaproteobacteria bacterium]